MTTSNKPGAGKNSEVIQRQNRQLVLRLVKEKQVTSRIELASLSGLKQATITNIVNDLLGMGYLEETGLIESANGRRVVGLQLNLEKMRVLVVRITASYYAAGIYDVYGECLSVKKEFIDTYQDFEETSRSIIACLKKCMRGCSGKHFLGLGIVFHGGNPAFRDEYLKPQGEPEKSTRLHELFYNVFKMPVFVHKFGDMVAYYAWERKEREQEKVHTLVCLSVGYAVDCAVVSYGRVLPNRLDGYGEYGHVSIDYGGKPCQCGNRGCIHGFVSVEAVMGMVKEKSAEYPQSCLTDPENIREVIKAYYDRDPLALAIYEKVAEILGVCAVNLNNQFNPDEIVLGDEIPNDEDFLDMVKEQAKLRGNDETAGQISLKVFKEKRKTGNDVGMKGMCRYIVANSFKTMVFDAPRR